MTTPLLLSALLTLAAFPAAGKEKRTFPAGFWERNAIPSQPCQDMSNKAVVKFEAAKPAEARESVMRFLKEHDAFFLPDECRDARNGQPPQNAAGAIVAWVDAGTIPALQTHVLRSGMLKQWQNMDPSYGLPSGDAVVEKWELLSTELAENSRLLKDTPLVRALTTAEIGRFAPHVEFYRKVRGKRLLEISVE